MVFHFGEIFLLLNELGGFPGNDLTKSKAIANQEIFILPYLEKEQKVKEFEFGFIAES